MNLKKVAIGLDIGGTNMKAGIVDVYGNVIGEPLMDATNTSDPREKLVARMLDMLDRAMSQTVGYDLVGIGVGCTGPLDIKKGCTLDCNNLPTLQNYPLKHIIEVTCGVDVAMNNDANAMILGEAWWGAGKQFDNILGITLGTGIGCAIIQNRAIVEGSTGNAGEIWTAPYRDGIIEDYASGPGLTRLYKEIANEHLSGYDVARLARMGDNDALQAFDEFADAITFALSWTINLLDPDAVILGGSVVKSSNLFLPRVKANLAKHITRKAYEHIQICEAQLGDNAGFAGAAALIFVEKGINVEQE